MDGRKISYQGALLLRTKRPPEDKQVRVQINDLQAFYDLEAFSSPTIHCLMIYRKGKERKKKQSTEAIFFSD